MAAVLAPLTELMELPYSEQGPTGTCREINTGRDRNHGIQNPPCLDRAVSQLQEHILSYKTSASCPAPPHSPSTLAWEQLTDTEADGQINK